MINLTSIAIQTDTKIDCWLLWTDRLTEGIPWKNLLITSGRWSDVGFLHTCRHFTPRHDDAIRALSGRQVEDQPFVARSETEVWNDSRETE